MTAATVRTLELALFRSWAKARVDTEGRTVALHGPNGAGKTNLLEAVSMLSPGRGLRRAAAEELPRAPDRIGWRVRARIAGARGSAEIEIGANAEARKRVEIDGKAAPATALGDHLRVLWLTPAMDRLWIEGPDGRRRWLDRVAMSFEPAHGETAAGYERAMRERNRLLRDGPADPAWLAALEARMAEAGVALARARARAAARLETAMKDAKTLFPKAEIAILGAFDERVSGGPAAGDEPSPEAFEMQRDFAAALAAGRTRDAAAGRALDGPHRADLEVVHAAKGAPARLCSTGEQKALLVSLTLANARALATGDGVAPALLLDEVAAHLDAERRSALYAEIAALGAQAWMTGTGPELFDALGPEAMTLAVREEGGASTIDHGA